MFREQSEQEANGDPMSDARATLDRRLASGEINEAEYQRIRAILDRSDADARATIARPVTEPPVPPPVQTRSAAQVDVLKHETGPISFEQADNGSKLSSYDWKNFDGTNYLKGNVPLGPTVAMYIFATVIVGVGCQLYAAWRKGQNWGVTILVVVWSAAGAIAVFRSARQYNASFPNKRWGRLAMIGVMFGFLASMINLLVSQSSPYGEIDRGIADLNVGLPKLISPTVRSEKWSRQDRIISADYVVIGPDANIIRKLPLEKAKELHDRLGKDLCSAPETKIIFPKIDAIHQVFRDEAGGTIFTNDITPASCKSAGF